MLPDWIRAMTGAEKLSLTVGGLAVLVAIATIILVWRQIGIMRRQTEIMEEQKKSGERMETLNVEMHAHTKKQAEIAETQHQIMQEQMSKAADLRVRAPSQNRSRFVDVDTVVTFLVMNGGDKTADGFSWELLLDEDLSFILPFIDAEGNKIKTKVIHLSETESYQKIEGYCDQRIFPGAKVNITRLSVPVKTPRTEEFWVMWRIKYEGGIVPKKGFTKIHFRRVEDNFYGVKHDSPFDEPAEVEVTPGDNQS